MICVYVYVYLGIVIQMFTEYTSHPWVFFFSKIKLCM